MDSDEAGDLSPEPFSEPDHGARPATSHDLWISPTDTGLGISGPLTASLSEFGKRLLWEQLSEAVQASPGNPEPALRVVEAWWRSMRIRQHPDYERRMRDPGPGRLYRKGELRQELGG